MSVEDGLVFAGALLVGVGLFFIDWRAVPLLYGWALLAIGLRRLL